MGIYDTGPLKSNRYTGFERLAMTKFTIGSGRLLKNIKPGSNAFSGQENNLCHQEFATFMTDVLSKSKIN